MGRIVTTGTFDGLHLGHVELLKSMQLWGEARGLRPLIVTFDRHPLTEIAPERVPGLLMLPDERNARLRDMGFDVEEMPFDARMRRITAAQWMDMLQSVFDARTIVLGYDNTFGSDGISMDIQGYVALGRELGIEVLSAPMVEGISSSAIRKALAETRIGDADKMLGYSWQIAGRVVHGRGMGRNLGFRTANLAVDPRLQLPACGVYASVAIFPDGHEFPAVTNIGRRPTFDDNGTVSLESHIIGFSGDLYGETIRLRLIRYLRGEKKFDTIAELKNSIATDVAQTMKLWE